MALEQHMTTEASGAENDKAGALKAQHVRDMHAYKASSPFKLPNSKRARIFRVHAIKLDLLAKWAWRSKGAALESNCNFIAEAKNSIPRKPD